jgi:hypothetical protein
MCGWRLNKTYGFWAHYALGYVYLVERRFNDSFVKFKSVLRRNPNFSLAQGTMALACCGRSEEPVGAAQPALRLSPHDPLAAVYCGIASYAHFVGRNYEDAMRCEGIRQRANFVGARRVLTVAARMAGQTDIAAAALQELSGPIW